MLYCRLLDGGVVNFMLFVVGFGVVVLVFVVDVVCVFEVFGVLFVVDVVVVGGLLCLVVCVDVRIGLCDGVGFGGVIFGVVVLGVVDLVGCLIGFGVGGVG